MPRSGIPQFFHPEIRHLVELALADAWQELKMTALPMLSQRKRDSPRRLSLSQPSVKPI
jgi:hypothetical protein